MVQVIRINLVAGVYVVAVVLALSVCAALAVGIKRGIDRYGSDTPSTELWPLEGAGLQHPAHAADWYHVSDSKIAYWDGVRWTGQTAIRNPEPSPDT